MNGRRIVAAAALAALVGCGGGGGGGDADDGPTADLTAGGYAASADVAMSQTEDSSALSSIVGMVSVESPASASRELAAARRPVTLLAAAQRRAVDRLLARTSGAAGLRERPQATSTSTVPCDSGDLVLSEVYAREGAATVGDTITVTSNACVVEGETLSGAMVLTLTRLRESSSQVSLSFDMVFDNFGSPSSRLDGAATASGTVTADSATITIAFDGVDVLDETAGALEWHHRVTWVDDGDGTSTVSFAGLMAAGGGFVSIRQDAPFVLDLNTGQPLSGGLTLTGSSGARVKVVAGTSRYQYQYFAAGNSGTTPDAQSDGLVYED